MKLLQVLNKLGLFEPKNKKIDVSKKVTEMPPKTSVQNKTEAVILLDLNHVNLKSKIETGKEAFKVIYKNPVKIYPYMAAEHAEIVSEDSLVGEADIHIKNNIVVAEVSLFEPFKSLAAASKNKRILYKPFGYVDLSINGNKEPDQILVDFIYVLF